MIEIHCQKCLSRYKRSKKSDSSVIKDGFFYRSSDRKRVQRYYCRNCKVGFSAATFSDCKNQKKRQLNSNVKKLLVGAVSLRECARILKIDRKTVARKLIFLGRKAKVDFAKYNQLFVPAKVVIYDDMETFEITKCKPVNIGLLVEDGSRRILSFNLAEFQARGRLTQIALRKYGPRTDNRTEKREQLFNEARNLLQPKVTILSDQNPHYPKTIKKYFPDSNHISFKGRLGKESGQGELKVGGFDPLFSLNHTAATLRARISRLIRKTWCTTKKLERLELHLALVCHHHNLSLQI